MAGGLGHRVLSGLVCSDNLQFAFSSNSDTFFAQFLLVKEEVTQSQPEPQPMTPAAGGHHQPQLGPAPCSAQHSAQAWALDTPGYVHCFP